MSDKDLQIRISELPKADFFDANSVTVIVGRSEGIQSTAKASLKELRDYFDCTSAYTTLKAGVDATKKDERFFVYTDASKVFATEYINIGGSAVQVQDPIEGVIYYPTRIGIVGSLGAGASVNSFADLRTTRPTKDGMAIFLNGYYTGSKKGGGEFYGFNGTLPDDGGMVAKGNGFYWVRNTDKVSPEMYGAKGDGVTDDTDALTRTFNSTLDVTCDGEANYLAKTTIVLNNIKRQQQIDGNGCTITYQDKSRGLINQYDANGAIQRYTNHRNFSNFILRGPANKNSSWATVSQCDGLNISNGIVENCQFYGWSNAMRGFGEAYVRNCYGDDLRTAMFSCYDPGYNEITDSSVGWCSGDAIILKGASAKAHNIDIVYAGCIDKNNEDGATALPGCILSMGADGAGSQNIQVSNISCQYFGCAGLNIQGDGVTVSGDMNLGSIYEDNFQSANQAAALWIGAKNFTIGNLHFGKVHIGVGINGNCANGSIGRISIMAKTNRAGSTLFSATDGPNSSITKVIVESIDFYGSSTINNDIYINTDGLYLKHFYVYSLNNSQGGYTVSLRKNARIGKMILAATTSSATNPVMLVESDSVIDHLEFRRVFGTALTVETNAKPVINKLTMPMKQGVLPPFVVKGDGTQTLYWGDVDITGPSVARPTINGKLCMLSYQGPTFRAVDSSVYAGVSYPNRSVDFVDELRMVGPAREGDTVELKSYVANIGKGGGRFVGSLTDGVDDGGVVIAGKGYNWTRMGDSSTFDITMFGAIPDGNTLIDNALIAMYKWAYNGSNPDSNIDAVLTTAQRHPGVVKFPKGIFAIGNVDLTSFGRKMGVHILGDVSSDFKSLGTTLILKAKSGYAISAKCLQVEIAGFNIIGTWNTDQSTCGFFNNVYADAPQQCRFRAFSIQHVGGITFNLVDTMDTEVTQVYMNDGQSTMVYAKWSGAVPGRWDHTTAIALRDVSVWDTKNNPVFFMPRCHQVQISNVWVSGCDHPGNFAQGSATTDQFNLEANKKSLQAENWRVVHTFLNTQGSFGIDYASGSAEIPASWDDNSLGVPSYVTDPRWEAGRAEINNHGFYSENGHVIENFRASRHLISNAGGTASWYKVGTVYLKDTGNMCRIKIVGCGGYNGTAGDLTATWSTGYGGGVAFIDVQNKGDAVKGNVTWYAENSPAILDVKYVQLSGSTVDIYVKVNTYTPLISVYCDTAVKSRYDSGIHFTFSFSGALTQDITAVANIKDAPSRWMVGNSDGNVGGFGMDFDKGTMVLGTNLVDVTMTGTCSIKIDNTTYTGTTSVTQKGAPIYVNGTLYYLIAAKK